MSSARPKRTAKCPPRFRDAAPPSPPARRRGARAHPGAPRTPAPATPSATGSSPTASPSSRRAPRRSTARASAAPESPKARFVDGVRVEHGWDAKRLKNVGEPDARTFRGNVEKFLMNRLLSPTYRDKDVFVLPRGALRTKVQYDARGITARYTVIHGYVDPNSDRNTAPGALYTRAQYERALAKLDAERRAVMRELKKPPRPAPQAELDALTRVKVELDKYVESGDGAVKWLPPWLREQDPLAVRGAQPYRLFSEGEGDRPAPILGAKRLVWVDFIRGQPSAGDHNLAQLIRAAEGTPGHLKRRIEWLDDALHVQRPMGPLKRGRGPSVKRARHRVRIRTFSGDEEDRLLLERWGPRPPMKAGRQTSASSWGHGRAASDAPCPANASGGGGLTGEQKARIARNKAAALERKRARLQGL